MQIDPSKKMEVYALPKSSPYVIEKKEMKNVMSHRRSKMQMEITQKAAQTFIKNNLEQN